MKLSATETGFLTALVREQTQSGGSGPAHRLLRENAYPDLPMSGPGSLAFSYEAGPLAALVLDCLDLQEIDDFLRKQDAGHIQWPWSSAQEYRDRLDQARREWAFRKARACPANGADAGKPLVASGRAGTDS